MVRQSELLLRESFGYQSLVVADEFVFRLRSNGLDRVNSCHNSNRHGVALVVEGESGLGRMTRSCHAAHDWGAIVEDD